MKQGIRKSVSWGGKAVMVALIAALALPTLFMGPASVAQAKAQPALLAMAAERPQATVRIIAQKSDESADAESMVQALGGQIVLDLPIIDAFAAKMSAAAARSLATSPEVAWVSLDGPVESAGRPGSSLCLDCPANTYLDTMGVSQVRQMGYDGTGVGVAIIDSGISKDADFANLWGRLSFSNTSNTVNDVYGHGTHVAGIVAGDGTDSDGFYQGVAPGATILGLKISDGDGLAYESDTVNAMQWALANKETYNLRVVNLSINSTSEMSYHQSPMDAAAEILWFNGIVVVASAGNRSDGSSYNTINTAPANDPFIITVGASDENGSTMTSDDTMATYSANDMTWDGYKKPDALAPGTNIYSVLSKDSGWRAMYPDRAVGAGQYFRLSGTSMAAPMVSGAVALLLQAEPNLTPDQVKYRLMNTGGTLYGDFSEMDNDFAYVNVYELLTTPTTESANTGLQASQLLTTGSEPVDSSVSWNSVSWNSVSWNSVSWNSVSWNSVSWNSVSWNSVSWNN
jgi:serine protease AprX